MSVASRVHAVVVNFQTPDLLETAVRSFCRHYPDVPLLIVDNGSTDSSRDTIGLLRTDLPGVSALMLEENRYHGPAMDLAIRSVSSEFVFLLDSDTETRRGGFLESMVATCDPPDVYACGKIAHVNRRGFASRSGTPVLVSAFMLVKRALYLDLPPFIHHGLPALQNFKAASHRGLRLAAYPIEDYVEHFGRGTAERYGYGLGIRSRIDFLLNKLGL